MDTLREIIIRSGSTWIGLAVASLVLAGNAPSFGEENEDFRYGLEGNSIVFTSQDQAIQGGSFRLAVKGGQEARIVVELVDIVSVASGSKKSLPLNSSPFTPSGLIEFADEYPRYQPNGEFQFFDIDFSFKEDEVLDRAVLGGLSISIVPEEKSDQQVTVGSSIVATFAYMPAGSLNMNEYAPELSLSMPRIERVSPDFFPLNMIPDLPFFRNHGDLQVDYELSNSGNIFLETESELIVQQLNIFGQPEVLRFSNSTAAFLVPGQMTQNTVEIQSIDSEKKNLSMGIYQFTKSAQGQIGDQIKTSVSNQQTLIIFPWKQTLLGLILLLALRKKIAKALTELWSYIQAFKEFRSSRKTRVENEPKPELLYRPYTLAPAVSSSSDNPVSVEQAPNKTLWRRWWQFAGMFSSLRDRFVLPKFSWRVSSLVQNFKWEKRAKGLANPKSQSPELQMFDDVQSSAAQSSEPQPAIKPTYSTKQTPPPPAAPTSLSSSNKGGQPRPLYPYWYVPPKRDN